MRLDERVCRELLSSARVGYLATTGQDLLPHVVPITLAVTDDRLVTVVDQKPKSTTDLRRLRNIADNPRVSVLCDHYSEEWDQLWWVRVDGRAMLVAGGAGRDTAIDLLTAKYPQYRDDRPQGTAVVIEIDSWTGWAFDSA
jgi:PPOX class probable F420-dependent enzyme